MTGDLSKLGAEDCFPAIYKHFIILVLLKTLSIIQLLDFDRTFLTAEHWMSKLIALLVARYLLEQVIPKSQDGRQPLIEGQMGWLFYSYGSVDFVLPVFEREGYCLPLG